MHETTEAMIAYIRHHHRCTDQYYIVEKESTRGWLFIHYAIKAFNPKRDKIVSSSLGLLRSKFETIQLGDAIEFHDPLFESICKITGDWNPETVRFYRKMWKEYPELRPEKFVEDLLPELKNKNILPNTPKETLH